MRNSRFLKGLQRLTGGNVAVTAAACLAPLLVLVGELTDRPSVDSSAHVQTVPRNR